MCINSKQTFVLMRGSEWIEDEGEKVGRFFIERLKSGRDSDRDRNNKMKCTV